MTEENIKSARAYYLKKDQYARIKLKKFTEATDAIERKQNIDLLPPLTKKQLDMKKIIHRRHSEVCPTLIGRSSPLDIAKMISRKAARVKTEPGTGPIIELYASRS